LRTSAAGDFASSAFVQTTVVANANPSDTGIFDSRLMVFPFLVLSEVVWGFRSVW
jgi:hypothetical protein